jgi:hypothetical protein
MTDRWPVRPLTLVYALVCTTLALVAFIPRQTANLAFWLLLVVTLPLSIAASVASYFIGMLIFGPSDGLASRIFNVGVWSGASCIQGIGIDAYLRSRTSRFR